MIHRDITLAIGENHDWVSYRAITVPSYTLAFKVTAKRDEKLPLKPITVELVLRYHLETDTMSASSIIRELVRDSKFSSVDANPSAVRSRKRAPLNSPAFETFKFEPNEDGETTIVEPALLMARIREDFIRRD